MGFWNVNKLHKIEDFIVETRRAVARVSRNIVYRISFAELLPMHSIVYGAYYYYNAIEYEHCLPIMRK